MADDYGLSQGLAFSTRASEAANNEINDIKYANELRRQNDALSMAKAQMFASDLDFQNGSNDFDSNIIKQENQQLISNLGKYVNENPDWTTNPTKAAELKRMKQQFKSTPAVLRSFAYKDAVKRLNDDMAEVAKNPNKYDTEAYDQLRMQVDNYNKYGNQKGKEAAAMEGPRPFTYQRPQDLINVPDTLLKAGKSINNFNVVKGNVLGEYMTQPKPDEVNAVVDSLKKEHGRSIELQARQLGLQTPEQVDKWLTNTVIAGFEPKYSPGDPNALWERGMRERELNAKLNKGTGPVYSPFDDLFNKAKPAGNVPSDVATKVWGDKPKIRVVGNRGEVADLTGLKMNYDNRYVTDSKGRRLLTGSVDVPIEVAKQVGIWDGDEEDGGISGAYLGKAVRRVKEGKDSNKTYVKVDYQLPIDYNDGTARQLYDTYAQPDKLVQPLRGDYGNQNIPSGSLNDWKAAGWNEDQIQQGVQQGKIQVK